MCGMSNEDFEKRFNNAMATIVENQARFDEAQARINANLARITERQDRFDEQMLGIQEAIAGLIQVARLNTEQIEKLVEDQRTTRENLNTLIRVVEDHISNHP